MHIYKTHADIDESHTGAVLAIGNFDGVHKGHQALLARTKEIAKSQGKPLAVLTFEPHPRKLFRPDDGPFRLTLAPLKRELLESFGVEILYELRFDWDFASLEPEDFIQTILKDALAASHIVIGQDFCFGKLRRGTPQMIRDADINVTTIDDVELEGERFASRTIRSALKDGKIDEANQLLGWEWEIRGEVIHGDKRGRELGYPTANVKLGETLHPAYGVYATQVQLSGESQWRPAATNIGIRPMFEVKEGLVEAHILDFDGDIYGEILKIRPLKRLRGEAKFETLEDLIQQMDRDCAAVRDLF